jgi:hypothetical protein
LENRTVRFSKDGRRKFMVLVLLGTQHNEFSRILDEIENCINNRNNK